MPMSRAMQERRNHRLFVEALACSKRQRVDPAQMVVRRLGDQPLDGIDGFGIGRLPQKANMSLASLIKTPP